MFQQWGKNSRRSQQSSDLKSSKFEFGELPENMKHGDFYCVVTQIIPQQMLRSCLSDVHRCVQLRKLLSLFLNIFVICV